MVTIQKKLTFLAGLFLLLLVGFSCESTKKELPNKQQLVIDCYVRYLQKDKQVKAEISFSELDSIHKIMPKRMEEVLFQQKVLDGKRILNRYRYQMIANLDYNNAYLFAYRQSGETFTQRKISILPIDSFKLLNNQVSKSTGTKLTITGMEFQKSEKLILLFSDEQNKITTIILDKPSLNQPVVIAPEQLQNLTTGKGTIYLVRQQTTSDTLHNALWTAVTEYYTDINEIEVID